MAQKGTCEMKLSTNWTELASRQNKKTSDQEKDAAVPGEDTWPLRKQEN